MPRLALLVAMLLLAGCQTTARYEPKGKPGSFGYSSQSISARRFVVMFEGDPVTEFSQTRDFALLRAAELTREAGGTHFKVIRQQNVIKRRYDEERIPLPPKGDTDWAGPPQSKPILLHREYPVAWFEIEICPAVQSADPDPTEVYDAAETQAILVKQYRLDL